MAKLSDFVISRVRVKLLKTFLSQPKEMFYVRELTRITHEEINAIRRELQHMVDTGMLKGEKRGNRLYYFFKPSYLFYPELLTLVAKSNGLGKDIIKNQRKLGHVKFAMLSGKFVRGLPYNQDEVDLLLVGQVVLPQLSVIVRTFEGKTGREVNYTVMTEEELLYRKTHRDPFVQSIIHGTRVMLIGQETELVGEK